MRFMSIASGSSGNCIYVGSDNTHILIDDGISKKKVEEGLNELDLSLDDIDAILITHEHDDHIKGLGVLERKKEIPIYATQGTLNGITGSNRLGRMPSDIYNTVFANTEFNIRDISVKSIRISHDANEPVAYRISCGSKSVGVITDLGFYDENIVAQFQNLDSMLVESNHDINMLQTGPYPYPLKRRIMGDKGHLSNETAGQLLCNILNDKVNDVFLGHLSKENNYAELAYETVRVEINSGECEYKADDFNIRVAKRDRPSDIIYL